MKKNEFIKIINFIEGYYGRSLSKNELISLKEELKDCSYSFFIENIKDNLLKSQYFTVAEVHRLKQNIIDSEEFLRRTGLKSWNDLYVNHD